MQKRKPFWNAKDAEKRNFQVKNNWLILLPNCENARCEHIFDRENILTLKNNSQSDVHDPATINIQLGLSHYSQQLKIIYRIQNWDLRATQCFITNNIFIELLLILFFLVFFSRWGGQVGGSKVCQCLGMKHRSPSWQPFSHNNPQLCWIFGSDNHLLINI